MSTVDLSNYISNLSLSKLLSTIEKLDCEFTSFRGRKFSLNGHQGEISYSRLVDIVYEKFQEPDLAVPATSFYFSLKKLHKKGEEALWKNGIFKAALIQWKRWVCSWIPTRIAKVRWREKKLTWLREDHFRKLTDIPKNRSQLYSKVLRIAGIAGVFLSSLEKPTLFSDFWKLRGVLFISSLTLIFFSLKQHSPFSSKRRKKIFQIYKNKMSFSEIKDFSTLTKGDLCLYLRKDAYTLTWEEFNTKHQDYSEIDDPECMSAFNAGNYSYTNVSPRTTDALCRDLPGYVEVDPTQVDNEHEHWTNLLNVLKEKRETWKSFKNPTQEMIEWKTKLLLVADIQLKKEFQIPYSKTGVSLSEKEQFEKMEFPKPGKPTEKFPRFSENPVAFTFCDALLLKRFELLTAETLYDDIVFLKNYLTEDLSIRTHFAIMPSERSEVFESLSKQDNSNVLTPLANRFFEKIARWKTLDQAIPYISLAEWEAIGKAARIAPHPTTLEKDTRVFLNEFLHLVKTKEVHPIQAAAFFYIGFPQLSLFPNFQNENINVLISILLTNVYLLQNGFPPFPLYEPSIEKEMISMHNKIFEAESIDIGFAQFLQETWRYTETH